MKEDKKMLLCKIVITSMVLLNIYICFGLLEVFIFKTFTLLNLLSEILVSPVIVFAIVLAIFFLILLLVMVWSE